jgi:hypothetical protein
MEAELSGLIQSRERVNNLLSKVARSGGSVYHTPQLQAPEDSALQTFKLSDLEGGLASASFQVLLEAAKKHASANPPAYVPQRNGRLEFRDFLLQMGSTAYPKQVKQCPAVEQVRARIAGESLIVSVHGYGGYDFSAEYTHVYKGKFSPKSAPDDLDAVLRRALRSVSPTISDGNCARYAEFASRIGPWEGDLAAAVCEETLRKRFPTWSALPLEVEGEKGVQRDLFRHVQIFVGFNGAGELSFSVRVRLSLELASAAPTPPKDAQSSVKAAAIAAAVLVDVRLEPETTLEAVYYREFSLNDAAIDAFSMGMGSVASGGKMQVPPPPPKRSKGVAAEEEDDIRVYLLVGTMLGAEGAGGAVEGAEGTAEGAEAEAEAQAAELEATRESAKSSKDTKEADADASALAQASFCVELYGWGFDSAHSLGLGPQAGKRKKEKDKKEEGAGADKLTDEQKIEQALAMAGEMVHGPRRYVDLVTCHNSRRIPPPMMLLYSLLCITPHLSTAASHIVRQDTFRPRDLHRARQDAGLQQQPHTAAHMYGLPIRLRGQFRRSFGNWGLRS